MEIPVSVGFAPRGRGQDRAGRGELVRLCQADLIARRDTPCSCSEVSVRSEIGDSDETVRPPRSGFLGQRQGRAGRH